MGLALIHPALRFARRGVLRPRTSGEGSFATAVTPSYAAACKLPVEPEPPPGSTGFSFLADTAVERDVRELVALPEVADVSGHPDSRRLGVAAGDGLADALLRAGDA